MDDAMWAVGALAFAALCLAALRRARLNVVVYDYQSALHYVDGKCVGTLATGRHTFWSIGRTHAVQAFDARPTTTTVAGQEVLSADGVSLKVSVLAETRLVDARRAFESSSAYLEALYARIQDALRAAVAAYAVDALLASRAELGEKLAATLRPAAADLGLELRSLAIKDFVFPGSLKEAFSQTARAKQAAAAALERARGESAALRNLANAARLLESQPGLYQLRLLQAAADSGKIVVNVAAPAAEGSSPAAKTPDAE